MTVLPPDVQTDLRRENARLQSENARLFNESREALERQTATADILKVIASSPSDVQPVFDAIATSSNRLIGGLSTAVHRIVDDTLHLAAFTPISPEADKFLKASFPRPLSTQPRADLTRKGEVVQIPDSEIAWAAQPVSLEMARLRGYRSLILVPLLRDGRPIGRISVTRKEPGEFTAHQVQLLQTFADQAVIAIENVRLFNETREALERQTATADILKVIASSPSDVQPVFDAIATSANRLVGGFSCTVARFIEGTAYLKAFTPTTQEADEILQSHFPQPVAGFLPFQSALAGEVTQVPDTEAMTGRILDIARARGFRSMLFAPLVNKGEPIGAIGVTRVQAGHFADHHVQLLKTFADQAVIAIENVRLFDEVQTRTRDLTESLEQQTATSEVLKVISSSPGELEPVFKSMLTNALRICHARFGILLLFDGEGFTAAELHNSPDAFAALFKNGPLRPGPHTALTRLMATKEVVHIADIMAPSDAESDPLRVASVRILQARSFLAVPMLKEKELAGAIVIYRQEVRPFNTKEIELVSSFASQAVIAIENTRLLKELRERTDDLSESLQQQTATADVLKVISRSAFDIQTVFETLIESAAQLCHADRAAILRLTDNRFQMVATHGFPPEFRDLMFARGLDLDRGSAVGRAALERRTIQIPDILADPEFTVFESQKPGGFRTVLGVPLMREGNPIGGLFLTRGVVELFTQQQIDLVTTFADQAVIAIENVRLFDEVQARTRDLSESLEQQTATSEVLKAISASPGELEPVFQAMLENAVHLCGAKFAMLFLYEDNEFRAAGKWNLPPAWEEYLGKNAILANPRIPMGRLALTHQPVHVEDVLTDQAYLEGYPGMVGVAELGGARTLLQVPLLRDNELVGTIGIYRQEVLPFTDKQIALVQSFAAQAVIAVENARLLNELRQRTDDLTESLNDLRTAQDRLVQTEKLASLGQLTAGIAHEIKNPLNFVNNFSALSAELTGELNDVLKSAALGDRIRQEVDELTGMLKENLEKVVQHGKRADSIVKNMLLHSREGSGEHRPADINALLDESLNLAYHGARAEKSEFNITLQRHFDKTAGIVEVFPQEITRVFLNLISNGFYAATKRKRENGGAGFEPVLSATTSNCGGSVEIRIRDNGTGIAAEVREKMFNPFFTTKPAGEGTGLGLSMSHDIIVKQHGGTIDVETEPGQFTEFRIVLPRTSNISKNTKQN